MTEQRRCGFVTDPPLARTCGASNRLWAVFYRVGTGRYLIDEPFIRCPTHLAATVDALSPGNYERGGWLDHIEAVKS